MSLIFPTILIVISLSVLGFFVYRKLPQLTLMDVDAIPEVKESKKKNQFLRQRVEKRAGENKKKWLLALKPAFYELKKIQLSFRKYVGKVERTILDEIRKEKENRPPEKKAEEAISLQVLLQEAAYSFEHENWDAAEKNFIKVITADPKNQDAYYGLGQIYQKKKQPTEAEETYKFLLQLNENHLGSLNKLAELAEESGKIQDAINYYERCLLIDDSKSIIFSKIANLLMGISQPVPALEAIFQAVELEPQNPKYLDNLLEIAIMVDNKKLAEEAWQKLRMVNPENQKLISFKERIEKM